MAGGGFSVVLSFWLGGGGAGGRRGVGGGPGRGRGRDAAKPTPRPRAAPGAAATLRWRHPALELRGEPRGGGARGAGTVRRGVPGRDGDRSRLRAWRLDRRWPSSWGWGSPRGGSGHRCPDSGEDRGGGERRRGWGLRPLARQVTPVRVTNLGARPAGPLKAGRAFTGDGFGAGQGLGAPAH